MFWYHGKSHSGTQLSLAIDDPGVCYGATCFTTMRVYDRSLAHPQTSWSAHCDRLSHNLAAFGWQQPNWQDLERGACLLAQNFPVLRLVVFPDGREWIVGRALPSKLSLQQASGVTAWIARDSLYTRHLPQYKTGNYLSAYLARSQALKHYAREAILLDKEGNWLETSTGNLWGWRDGCWYTPCLESGVLPGIARSCWLDSLRSRNLKVVENIWHPQFVSSLTALGYSNCVVEYLPIIATIDGNQRQQYSLELRLSND
ncbi:MAG: aminotransferase class IV [Cyanobacteria bacterium J06623_7]